MPLCRNICGGEKDEYGEWSAVEDSMLPEVERVFSNAVAGSVVSRVMARSVVRGKIVSQNSQDDLLKTWLAGLSVKQKRGVTVVDLSNGRFASLPESLRQLHLSWRLAL